MLRPLFAVALLTALCGCDSVNTPTSDAYPAEELILAAQLRSNGGLAQAIVRPRAEEGPSVTIDGEDVLLFAPVGGPEVELAPFEISYLGQVTTEATDFELIFAREGERFVYPAPLPPPFALVVPEGPVARSESILITWEPADPAFPMRLEVDSPCMEGRIDTEVGTGLGATAINPGDFSVKGGPAACEVQVTMTRTGTGFGIAPGRSPRIQEAIPGPLQQVRSATIVTVP